MARYTGWHRRRVDIHEQSTYATYGRKLLGALMEDIERGGLFQGVRRQTLPDGTVITARFDGATPVVEVNQPVPVQEEPEKLTFTLAALEGFVLFPASDSAPAGWGLPVQMQSVEGSSTDPQTLALEPQNLAPGTDVTRWTPNGALGQVLLTTRENAGYAEEAASTITAPLFYSAIFGPKPDKDLPEAKETDPPAWTAYRIEFTGFTAQSPSTSATERADITAQKTAEWGLINTHRVGLGLDPMVPPIRGFYDSGQLKAELMHNSNVMGHMWEGWPIGFRTPYDTRLHDSGQLPFDSLEYGPYTSSVDGFNSRSHNFVEICVGSSSRNIDIGQDSNGVHTLSMTPGPPITAGEAFAAWMGSPPHKASIERETRNTEEGVCATATSMLPGFRSAFGAVHMVQSPQWLSCGNRQFLSDDPAVPMVSWMGFDSLNLAYETWDVSYRINELFQAVADLTYTEDDDPFNSFTASFENMAATFRYYEMDAPTVEDRDSYERKLSPYVYSQGRIIGIAPDGASVWAAAVVKLGKQNPADDEEVQVHRLVIIAHHHADQPVAEVGDTGPHYVKHGQTSYLRTWYCDIPERDGQALRPQIAICGRYGQEKDYDDYPWTQENNPWGWRGGELIDVGSTDGTTRDSLKYASQWVFSPDGKEACCLRDHATWKDYLLDLMPSQPPAVSIFRLISKWAGIEMSHGLNASLWTLSFTHTATAMSTTAQWHGDCPTGTLRQLGEDVWFTPIVFPEPEFLYHPNTEARVYELPIAAGYDASGTLRIAKSVNIVPAFALAYPDGAHNMQASGVMFGTYADTFETAEMFSGWTSMFPCASVQTADRWDCGSTLICDIAEMAYIRVLTPQPRFFISNGRYDQEVVSSPWDGFNFFETDTPCVEVQMYMGATLLTSKKYPNPDGFSANPTLQFCWHRDSGNDVGGKYAVRNISHAGIGSFTRSGQEWIFNFNFQPQVSGSLMATGATCNECRLQGLNFNEVCTPMLSNDSGAAQYGLESRGSITFSSFATEAELHAMTGTTGADQRFLYARAI